MPNVSAFRVIRVLRPLRSLTIVPGMRLLVMSLLRSIPALLEVLLLLLFAFAIFGILGLQLWVGLFHSRCRLTEAPVRLVGAPQGFPPECKLPSEACTAMFMTNSSGAAVAQAAYGRLATGGPGAADAFLAASVRYDPTLQMKVTAGFNSSGLVPCLPGVPVESDAWQTQESSPWSTPRECFWPVDSKDERVCSLGGLGEHTCGAGRFCGSNYDTVGNRRFVDEEMTRWANRIEGLNWGLTTFDHIMVAVLSIFQSITMEGWSDIMYMVMDSYNGVVGGVYFVVLILFGSFFLLNLLLAVIWEQFSESQKQEEEDKAERLKNKNEKDIEELRRAGMRDEATMRRGAVVHADAAAASGMPPGTPEAGVWQGDAAAAAPAAEADGGAKGHRGAARDGGADEAPGMAGEGSGMGMAEVSGTSRERRPSALMDGTVPADSDPKVPSHQRGQRGGGRGSSKVAPVGLVPAGSGQGAAPAAVGDASRDSQGLATASATMPAGAGTAGAAGAGRADAKQARFAARPDGERGSEGGGGEDDDDGSGPLEGGRDASSKATGRKLGRPAGRGPRLSANATMILSGDVDADTKERVMHARRLEGQLARNEVTVDEMRFQLHRANSLARVKQMPAWQRGFHSLAVSPELNFTVMVLIVVNTAVLGWDHYPMEAATAEALEVINFVLTILFAIEMMVKILGLGIRRYGRDPFNAFDAVIVLTTIVELFLLPPSFITVVEDSAAAGGGISALRTFRLFRVFALAKQWTSLRVLLHTILRTLKDVANFAVLLLLFMYIFSLIGMQFFANQLCFDPVTGQPARQFQGVGGCPAPFERPRAHFDDLLWAFVTVFQVLTGENWNVVMYSCWLAVGWAATLYFIALVVIGNFMILNLFLAILLGNFEGMEELVASPDDDASGEDGSEFGSKANISHVMRRLRNALTASKTSVRVGVTDGGEPIDSPSAGNQRAGSAPEGVPGVAGSRPPLTLTPSHGRGDKLGQAASSGDATRPANGGLKVTAIPSANQPSAPGHSGSAAARPAAVRGPHGMPPTLPDSKRQADTKDAARAGGERDRTTSRAGESASGDRRGGERSRRSSEPSHAQPADAPPAPAVLEVVEPGSEDAPPFADLGPPVAAKPGYASAASTPGGAAFSGGAAAAPSAPMLPPGGTAAGGPSEMPGQMPEPAATVGGGEVAGSKRVGFQNDTGLGRVKTAGGVASPVSTGEGNVARMTTSAMFTSPSAIRGGDPSVVRNLRKKKRLYGNALCLIPPTNPWRQQLGKLVQSNRFENLIIFLIVTSSILLAIDSPLADPSSPLSQWLQALDIAFAVVFTLEMVLKVLTFGFACHQNAYLRDPWNILDFCIVVVSLVSVAAVDNPALKSLRSLRTFRALRPLRMISRNKGMRLVVNALFSSMPAILNVLFVCLLFFLIFGIIGVSYFKGAFRACMGPGFGEAPPAVVDLIINPAGWAALSNATRAAVEAAVGPGPAAAYAAAGSVQTGEAACLLLGFEWGEVIPSTFDNIFSAMGTMVEMATTEGWVDVLLAGVDSRGIGAHPVRDSAPGWAAFFVGFMVVGNFFVLNLFVGVVIDNFNRMKVKLGVEAGQSIFATPEQREWQKTRKYALMIRPFKKEPEPTNACRRCTLRIVRDNRFEWGIVVCILINTAAMAATFFTQPSPYSLAFEIVNYVFAAVFTIEAVLKLIALGGKYFCDADDASWNIFDFVIVVGTNVGILLQVLLQVNVGSVATVVRTFRVGRIFRLVQRAKKIKFYFSTLIQTLPSLANIGGLLFLLFFIYAVMGVQLFADVRLGDSLNAQANFQSFGLALLTLMRFSTGESWNYVMYEAAASSPGCRVLSDLPYSAKSHLCGYSPDKHACVPIDGCGNAAAFPFFYSFTVFVTFVFLNLFIAVVLEAFSDSSEEEAMKLKKEDFAQLADAWLPFDPDATCLMPASQLPDLIRRLEPPLGFSKAVRSRDVTLRKAIRSLRIQIHRPPNPPGSSAASDSGSVEPPGVLKVHFADVAQSLAERVFDDAARTEGKVGFVPPPASKQDERERLRLFGKGVASGATDFDMESYVAAKAIERLFKAYKFRKQVDSRIDGDTAVAPAGAGAGAAAAAGRGGQSYRGHRGPPPPTVARGVRGSPRVGEQSTTSAKRSLAPPGPRGAGGELRGSGGLQGSAGAPTDGAATSNAGRRRASRHSGESGSSGAGERVAASGSALPGQREGSGNNLLALAPGLPGAANEGRAGAADDDDDARRARMAGPPARLAGGDDDDARRARMAGPPARLAGGDDDDARRARMAGPPARLAGGDDHDLGVDEAAGARRR